MSAIILLLAFLLGSILGGQIIGRLRGLDLRHSGSGNLGATNALRSGGKVAGLLVLLIDTGKAWAAVSLLPSLQAEPVDWLPWACGALVILGHVFSPLAGFRGGKGVASAMGACAALLPQALLLGLTGFLLGLVLSGFVSLAVVLAASLILFHVACLSAIGALSHAGAFALGILLLILWTHRDNWRRLIRGEENRFTRIMLFKPDTHRYG